MNRKLPANPERSFGLSVGSVLVVVAAVAVWRERITLAEILGVTGVVLVGFGWLRPSLLKRPSDVWWRFALLLAHVNARVILTVVFAVVLTPVGLAWRLLGRDPLARRRRSWSGWSPYPARYRDRTHYSRMY